MMQHGYLQRSENIIRCVLIQKVDDAMKEVKLFRLDARRIDTNFLFVCFDDHICGISFASAQFL